MGKEREGLETKGPHVFWIENSRLLNAYQVKAFLYPGPELFELGTTISLLQVRNLMLRKVK